MKSTQPLMNEYEDINLMFDIVGQVYRQLETSGDMERDHLDAITEYLKGVVDKFHQQGISTCSSPTVDRLPH